MSDGATGQREPGALCLLWPECEGGQEAEVTRGEQTESNAREWRESASGCWSYCGGRTGWTGTAQLKLFNPHLKPQSAGAGSSQVLFQLLCFLICLFCGGVCEVTGFHCRHGKVFSVQQQQHVPTKRRSVACTESLK